MKIIFNATNDPIAAIDAISDYVETYSDADTQTAFRYFYDKFIESEVERNKVFNKTTELVEQLLKVS